MERHHVYYVFVFIIYYFCLIPSGIHLQVQLKKKSLQTSLLKSSAVFYLLMFICLV